MAPTNDRGVMGLLELLREHPELVRELVLDPEQIKKLLSGPARRAIPGGDLTGFLKYMSEPEGGYPIAFAICGGSTGGGNYSFCAKGTGASVCAAGRTGPGST